VKKAKLATGTEEKAPGRFWYHNSQSFRCKKCENFNMTYVYTRLIWTKILQTADGAIVVAFIQCDNHI
jgi:hypothetical protein